MVMALATAAFLAFGGLLVLVGSAQAGLIEQFDASLEQLGLLAGTTSLGLGAGIALSGPAADRWPRRPMFVGASALAALALAAAGEATTLQAVALALAAAGFGAGAFETILNAVISEPLASARGARWRPDQRLVFVHLGATVGAMVAPALIAALVQAGGVGAAFRGLAVGFAALAAWGAWVPLARPARSQPDRAGETAASAGGGLSRRVLPFVVAGLAYVGFETALTAFAPTLVASEGGGPGRVGRSISAFWLGLLVGRVAFLLWPRPPQASALIAAGLCGLLVGGVGFGFGLPGELLFAAIGFGFGPTFPVLMALVGDRFRRRRATAMGLVAGAGAAGGALVPWLAGRAGDAFGPAAIAAVLAACCVLLVVAGRAAASESATGS